MTDTHYEYGVAWIDPDNADLIADMEVCGTEEFARWYQGQWPETELVRRLITIGDWESA